MNINEIMQNSQRYEFVFAECLSKKFLGRNLLFDDYNEIIDARFFGVDGELHVYKNDEQYCSSEYRVTSSDNVIDSVYELKSNFCSEEFDHIVISDVLDTDDDGQSFISRRCFRKLCMGEK